MNHSSLLTTYTCQDDIYWVKDTEQVIIIAEQKQESFLIQGLEASIWDWLVLDYSYHQIHKFISTMLSVSEFEAKGKLTATLNKWVDDGILKRETISNG